MEETIDEYIIRESNEQIAILEKRKNCKHVWVVCGPRGYMCANECGFHTDAPHTIELIKNSQKSAQ